MNIQDFKNRHIPLEGKNKMKQTLKIVITYFSLILSFMLLLTISSVFPSKYKHHNEKKSHSKKCVNRQYTILKGHSYKHAFFTYRNILITNICADLFLEKIFEMFTKSNEKMIESRRK